MVGFLHPSEMTPEERLEELAEILAGGILRLKVGKNIPENQAQVSVAVADKSFRKHESFLELSRHQRPDVDRKMTQPMDAQDHARIAKQVASLADLTVNQLQKKWVEVWNEPCRSRNKDFLRKRVAWRIQANAYGGLSQRALQRAAELADETLLKIRNPAPFGPPSSDGRTIHERVHAPGDPRIPAPGAVITRDYKGRKLLVAVLEKGFEFEGRVYRSLTAIAKEVTGTHWNGFHFFGLDGGRRSE